MSNLFSSGSLSQFIDNRVRLVVDTVKTLGSDTFKSNGCEQIVEHICSKYSLVSLELMEDEKETDFTEIQIDAHNRPSHSYHPSMPGPSHLPGYKLTWSIPFRGAEDLFRFRPSKYMLRKVEAMIQDGKLSISVEIFRNSQQSAEESLKEIQAKMDGELGLIKEMIDNVNKDVSVYNSQLKGMIIDAVNARKTELEKLHALKSALRVNVKPKEGASLLNKIEVKTIPLSTKKTEPGACIDDKAYNSILQAIRNMGASMEATKAAESKDEEGLRDILLVGLNASISEGSAGGELFRKKGKTDIAILFENNAAFVAECKLWRGREYLIQGLNQLLGYLTWRDAKTALIVFNRGNKNFSSIQKQVEQILREHKDYMKNNSALEGEWQFLFRKPDDENRMILVHIFLIDIYMNID